MDEAGSEGVWGGGCRTDDDDLVFKINVREFGFGCVLGGRGKLDGPACTFRGAGFDGGEGDGGGGNFGDDAKNCLAVVG